MYLHIVAFGTKIVYPTNNCYFSYNVYFIFKKLSNIFKNRTRYFSDYCEKGTVCEGTMFVCRILEMIAEMVRNKQVCAPVQYYRLFINKSLRMKCVRSFIFKNNTSFVFFIKNLNSITIMNTTLLMSCHVISKI